MSETIEDLTDRPPRRRLHFRLDMGADDLTMLAQELRILANDLELERREERETTSGGYNAGYHLTLTCDPEQTGDKFRDELEMWRQRRVEARRV